MMKMLACGAKSKGEDDRDDYPVTRCANQKDGRNWSLPPYLVWASIWYAFFLFAVNIRVPSMLWEPVYLWVFAQVTLLEPATGDLGRRAALGLIFVLYLVAGSVLWIAVESRSRTGSWSVWRRSGIAWAAVVVSSMLVSFVLLRWI